jgi:ADP-heptose:LPS heptosyltransferase
MDLHRFERPAVFYANGLGDTILAVPALRALAALIPWRLTLICDANLPQILLAGLRLRRTVRTRMVRNIPDWTREFDFKNVLRRVGRCDFFISLVPWHSQSLQVLLDRLGSAGSIGYSEQFEVQIPLDFRKHASDLSFDLPLRLHNSLRFEDYAAPLSLGVRARRLAAKIRKAVPGGRLLVVHADTGANKMWPAERFVETLNEFLERHPEFIVLLIGAMKQPLDHGRHLGRIMPCYGIPFHAALGIVESADIFLGVDSCMLHAADFFRIPSVGLFGASNPREFGFRLTRARIICEAKSMEGIETQTVIQALERLARSFPTPGPA